MEGETQNELDKTNKGVGLWQSGRWKEEGAREPAQGRGKTSSSALPSLTPQLALNKFPSTPAKAFPAECVFCTMAVPSGPLVSSVS